MARDEKRAKPSATTKKRTTERKLPDGTVVVGSEVGVTLPIGDSTAHLRFSFWHERISPSSSVTAIRRTADLVDEFNEQELERRVRKYQRIIKRTLAEDDDGSESHERPRKKKKGSVQDRAKKRMRK